MLWCNNSVTNIKQGPFGPHRIWPDTVTADINIRIYLLTVAITTNTNYTASKTLIPYYSWNPKNNSAKFQLERTKSQGKERFLPNLLSKRYN